MSQENPSESPKQPHTHSTARSFEEAAELVKTVIVSVSELVPLFLEKWAVVKDKPVYTEIKDEQRRIKRRLHALSKRQRQWALLTALLLVWNIGLSLYVILRL